jgi:hypothetical protein
MTLESPNSYEDPRVNMSIFAKGDPPPNGTNSGGTAADEGDPPPNGSADTSETSTGDPPPNGAS